MNPAEQREQAEWPPSEAVTAEPEGGQTKSERMLDGIPDGCVALDANWHLTYVNAAAARVLGKPAAELLGTIFWQHFPSRLGGELEHACQGALADQVTVKFEQVFPPGNRWYDVKAYPISSGELALCFRDITEQKRKGETMAALRRDLEIQAGDLSQLQELGRRPTALVELEPMLREVLQAALVVDGADMGLLSMRDPHHGGLRTIVSSGFGPEFLQICELIPPGISACSVSDQQNKVVIVEDVEQDPLFVRYRDSAKIGGFRSVHSTPLTIRGSSPVGVVSLFFREPHRPSEREIRLIDLYARQAADGLENARLVGEIAQAREAAKLAAQAKDNFLAALARELRVPLDPVLLVASEGAANPELSPEVREDFSKIAQSVTMEARLIDDLLDLTGVPRGKRALDLQPSDVHEVLQKALLAIRPELERKRIALSLSLRAKHYAVMGDAVRLQQVIWNVLNNAVKFTREQGTIVLETRNIVAKGLLAITVTDSGIGMTESELGSVFKGFSQGLHTEHKEGESSHRAGGAGLGLAHSRMLVELHAGRIRAFSAGRNQGSTFVIELPIVAPEKKAGGSNSSFGTSSKPPVLAQTDAAGHRCRILLVEDHVATRVALEKLLARRRYDVSTAGSVSEAVALADRKEFDLLVADIGLPDADGYELMTTLRERHGLKGIAVTGYGMEQDVVRSKAAGFVAHLTKPVSAQTIERALAAAAAG